MITMLPPWKFTNSLIMAILLLLGFLLSKDLLRKKTNEAYEKGVFGAPTFLVNNKIFWGQDRIEFALREASK